MDKIAILGAGMAGFGAAYRLYEEGMKGIVYEKKRYYGGHSTSFKYNNGFIFDVGPHVSFTKDKRIQELFAESVNKDYQIIKTNVNNYWHGHWIKHPAQCNLYGLPPDLTVDILNDFIHAQNNDCGEIHTYADWLKASFGKTFAETFPMEYGLKFHTTTPDNMSTDWLGPRLYRPKLKEILFGALSPTTTDVHYISNFRYPTYNGFVSYFNSFLNSTELELGYEVIQIEPVTRMLHFANKKMVPYDYLVSSIPLPELIPMIKTVPEDVVEAAHRLACTTCIIVNLGIDRENISEAHWTYIYDRDIIFTRLSFPHMLSSYTVPPGTGSIQAEIYYSKKYRPLDRLPEEYIEPVIHDLKSLGLVLENDEILFKNAMLSPYANVIFDLDRADALNTVHGYLDDIGIAYCGRFGEWGYLWTDESFKSGEIAAQKIFDKISPGRVTYLSQKSI